MSRPRWRPDADRDRGEIVVELVLLVPVIVLLLMAGLQVGVQAHESHVASAAAARGAAAAAAWGGTPAAGTAAALEMLGELGSKPASMPHVEWSASEVGVVVAIVVPRLLPMFPAVVSRRVIETRERIMREWER